MKISIKYLLGLLITPLLCGVSFGYNRFENLSDYQVSSIDSSDDYIIREPNTTYCVYVSGLNSSKSYSFYINNDSWGDCNVIDNDVSAGITDYNYCFQVFSCNDLMYGSNGLRITAPDLNLPMKVYKFNSSNTPINITPDCSSVQSQLSSCQSDLSSCTNSCDTLVSQCQSDKATLQTSYSGCLESLGSLNEYNSSLNEQLQECLISGSLTSGDLTIYEYQLSRNDGFSDLYLPITNSIKLPYGYRGFLDDGVLAIKNLNSLDTAYTINNEDFEDNVIGSYGTVFLFFMSLGLFLIFVYAIRRYFIGLKSIK